MNCGKWVKLLLYIINDLFKNGVENSKTWIQGPGPLSEARSRRELRFGAGIIENRRVPTPFRMENVNHVDGQKFASSLLKRDSHNGKFPGDL